MVGHPRSLIEIAHRNAERLITLVNDILDIERIEGGRLEFTFRLVDLAGLVKEAVEANQSFASVRGVTIRIAAAPPFSPSRSNHTSVPPAAFALKARWPVISGSVAS